MVRKFLRMVFNIFEFLEFMLIESYIRKKYSYQNSFNFYCGFGLLEREIFRKQKVIMEIDE